MSQRGRRSTIVEVARAAGVSVTTVSMVLNDRPSTVRISEATRAAVKNAAAQLGYIPNSAAQNLRRKRPSMLTLLVGSLANPFFTDIAASIHASVVARGFELNVVDAALLDAELRTLDQLRNGSSAGVIVATGRHGKRGHAIAALQRLVQSGLPAVIMSDRSPDPAIPAIRIDDEAGAYVATNHLVKLGHRHIAHLTGGRNTITLDEPSVEGDRFRGYLRALTEGGISFEPSWLVQGEATLQGGYALTKQLFSHREVRPTALFCVSDLLALGALRGLYEVGLRVPDDVAVVGFDGIALGRFTTPALTTMDQPRAEMGRIAAGMLFALLEGQGPVPDEQVLTAHLLVRESCGAEPFHRL